MQNDILDLLLQIFKVCIVPLLGVLTTFLVKFIQTKSKEIIAKTDNDVAKKYLAMVTNTITTCVTATNQTYVDSLKDKNAFDKEAQEEAFKMTLNAVVDILSEDTKEYLYEAYGDISQFLTEQIEATVNKLK